MKRQTFWLLIWLLSPIVIIQAGNLTPENISIVPRPVHLVPVNGEFFFSAQTVFSVENKHQEELARCFIELFSHSAGFSPKITINDREGDVCFSTDRSLKSEAYLLKITPTKISIKAADTQGFFYALQTLRLLLPAAIESEEVVEMNWTVPCATVEDEPRFGYRGLMLDVARFFIPKENVLRIIDCMAMLKINRLHFHLVDDNGWRLEVKKHPRLTEVGAWRVDRSNVPFPERRNALPNESTPVGGFYTQEDIREIVAYAERHQVEVIPEIEMPAHTNAALAAYPQLACPVVKKFIGVLPGLGGSHADIIYCAGNDTVFTFLQDVIDEVLTLFPSRYIHLGGDEAWKTNWKECPLCQKRIREEHLPNEEALQGYFMNRMASYVRSKGKEVMGWDELTNSILPKDAIIFGWQGFGRAALKAAEKGHRFVMTPARVMYLIRYQGPQWFEPLTYFGNNTLRDVYNYEPVQEDWKPAYERLLMGVQASMWTEFCNNPVDVEYQLFPRLAALAEVAWSQKGKKNWTRFLDGLDTYNKHLDEKRITYARSMYNIQHTVTVQKGALQIKLECIRPDMNIRYTVDGSEPTLASQLYKGILSWNKAGVIKCATFAKDKQMGNTLVLPIVWNKATAKTVLEEMSNEQVLTNGVRGSLKHTDFEWSAWQKNDSVSFTVDLLEVGKLTTCTLGCLTNYGMGAHKPTLIRVEVSNNNKTFVKAGELQYTPEQIFQEGTFIENCTIDMGGKQGRYVRVTARGVGNCPDDHVRPGQESRIYFDEIIIE